MQFFFDFLHPSCDFGVSPASKEMFDARTPPAPASRA
jgi:hypothetical protein